MGCVLSCVSKSIRAICAPFRYYSVAIKDLSSALHFAELIETAPKGSIRVSHLYFSNDTVPRQHDYIVNPQNEDLTAVTQSGMRRFLSKLLLKKYKRITFKKKESILQRRDIVAEALQGATGHTLTIDVIHRILIKVTESLLSLSITHRHRFHWLVESLKIPVLPNLKELSISVRVRGCNCNNIDNLLHVFSSLPALERFDLSGMHRFDTPNDIILNSAHRFPQLTHICLPIMWNINTESVAKSIARALRELDSKDGQSSRLPCENGEIRERTSAPMQLFVQLDPSWNINDHGWRFAEDIPSAHENRAACLESLKECAAQHPGRLRIHERSRYKDTAFDEQEQNWMDRASGGAGCWAVDSGALMRREGPCVLGTI